MAGDRTEDVASLIEVTPSTRICYENTIDYRGKIYAILPYSREKIETGKSDVQPMVEEEKFQFDWYTGDKTISWNGGWGYAPSTPDDAFEEGIYNGSDFVRKFETGATRDTDTGKYDYEGFLNPDVLEEFAKYMHEHRMQKDGELRASDNWQKGMPRNEYMKSLWRHFHDAWKGHRNGTITKTMLCAMMFNTMGYMLEMIKEENNDNGQDVPPSEDP